jgi:F-type H+-transporting ATPase subunit gamma
MNFRQVGKKIKTIGNVKKITKAMQMVSAVKMKKAQRLALQGKPYRNILEKMIIRVTTGSNHQFVAGNQKEEMAMDKKLYIIISSNKGLAGSFNFNLFKHLFANVNFEKNDFITLGRKGAQFIAKMGGHVVADFSEEVPFIKNVSALYKISTAEFLTTYSSVHLVYNNFISTFKMVATIETLLPITKEEIETLVADQDETEYIIEPSREAIMESLINEYIKEKIIKAILNSEAAEHSARMMAMKSATDNAQDIIYNLTMFKNKLRQSSITNELLDMTIAKESAESAVN